MSQVLTIIAIISNADFVLGKATVSLPTSANCGNQAVLTCTSTDCNLYRFIKNGVTIYNHAGPVVEIGTGKYSGNVTSNSTVKLTINNIQLSDAGDYDCTCGFDDATPQTMRYTCKANTSMASITKEKKLNITVDNLYPQPSSVVTSLTSHLPGSYACGDSSNITFHKKCTWVSTTSLTDGYHTYTMTVTTGGQTASVTGSFKIITPASPTISNLVAISNNRQALSCIQEVPLTIKCMSSGGIPTPTLAWYRGSTNTTPLALSSTSDSVYQSDGTHQVTLNHTFTPGITDDMTSFLCRVFYPGATPDASPDPTPAMAFLYLELKLGNVTVSQIGKAISGESMTLRCTSTNGRPAPNITWSYRDQNFTPNKTSSLDTTSETYTVVSDLQRPVSAADNGQPATCRVTHTTLSESLTGAVIVNVKFGALKGSATISGNRATPATGATQIRLNCTSGSSNPGSNITWYNESDVISNAVSNKEWSGDNDGVVTSSILTITPTRYMDGNRITCRIDNIYDSDNKYVDLDILYSPMIQPLLNITLIEGEPDVSLTCLASSKPPANFTWSNGDSVLANGTGTLTHNSFSYVIPRVGRADAGSYQCQAGNSVGSPDQKSVYLIVKYPPTVTVSSTTSQPYKVTCTAKGYPDNYTYQDWVQVWPGYGPVATIPFTETTLTLTDITYEMSGVYVCGVSNAVALYGTDVEFVKGNASILIKAPPVLTDPSNSGTRVPVAGTLGQDATTEIKYWSNVNDTVVKCYKRVADSRSAFSSCSVTETDTEVMLPVHNHMVKENGTLAIIKIHISSQENMTAYDVVVSNSEQGESVLEIIVVPQDPQTPSPSIALIGGIVGTMCALLIVAIIVVVLWRIRKAGWVFSQKADKRSLAKDQDNTDSVMECAMYVSAGNVQPGASKSAVYSTPQKRACLYPSANAYAVVSKTKKCIGDRKRATFGNPTQGLPEIPQMAETSFDTTQNATSNLPLQSMKNATDDGLIYADLEFDSNVKYDVIHGLDDVTIYVEIDFTKTAEPLPDSDEDSTEKK